MLRRSHAAHVIPHQVHHRLIYHRHSAWLRPVFRDPASLGTQPLPPGTAVLDCALCAAVEQHCGVARHSMSLAALIGLEKECMVPPAPWNYSSSSNVRAGSGRSKASPRRLPWLR